MMKKRSELFLNQFKRELFEKLITDQLFQENFYPHPNKKAKNFKKTISRSTLEILILTFKYFTPSSHQYSNPVAFIQ